MAVASLANLRTHYLLLSFPTHRDASGELETESQIRDEQHIQIRHMYVTLGPPYRTQCCCRLLSTFALCLFHNMVDFKEQLHQRGTGALWQAPNMQDLLCLVSGCFCPFCVSLWAQEVMPGSQEMADQGSARQLPACQQFPELHRDFGSPSCTVLT